MRRPLGGVRNGSAVLAARRAARHTGPTPNASCRGGSGGARVRQRHRRVGGPRLARSGPPGGLAPGAGGLPRRGHPGQPGQTVCRHEALPRLGERPGTASERDQLRRAYPRSADPAIFQERELVFLPAGDAALSRRAKNASGLSAVVVRFARTRKRYERPGVVGVESASHAEPAPGQRAASLHPNPKARAHLPLSHHPAWRGKAALRRGEPDSGGATGWRLSSRTTTSRRHPARDPFLVWQSCNADRAPD